MAIAKSFRFEFFRENGVTPAKDFVRDARNLLHQSGKLPLNENRGLLTSESYEWVNKS